MTFIAAVCTFNMVRLAVLLLNLPNLPNLYIIKFHRHVYQLTFEKQDTIRLKVFTVFLQVGEMYCHYSYGHILKVVDGLFPAKPFFWNTIKRVTNILRRQHIEITFSSLDMSCRIPLDSTKCD